MSNTIRIKRRANGGGSGAPTTLANAELAFNEQTNILYYGTGTGGAGGSATSIIPIAGSGAFAPLASPALTGTPTAPTASLGTDTTQIATTAFVINNSGFFTNKIYQANSYLQILDTGAGNISLNIDGTLVLSGTSSGVNLLQSPTTPTVGQTYNDAGSSAVASTQYAKTATQWWGGSAKFVSNAAPQAGVNDIGSNNGDFWFQIGS